VKKFGEYMAEATPFILEEATRAVIRAEQEGQ
jgi:hypothetical protein